MAVGAGAVVFLALSMQSIVLWDLADKSGRMLYLVLTKSQTMLWSVSRCRLRAVQHVYDIIRRGGRKSGRKLGCAGEFGQRAAGPPSTFPTSYSILASTQHHLLLAKLVCHSPP